LSDPERLLCPAYAQAVMRLVSKKFVFELVRQQWLKLDKNPKCLKAIHFLPLKPYRDMLADLMEAHVITEHFAIAFFFFFFFIFYFKWGILLKRSVAAVYSDNQ
jgi:hypothetical protein